MIEAGKQHKDLVIRILVSAFEDIREGNSINFVVKQDGNRKKRMKVLMGYLFEKALSFGKVFISDNKKACLLIIFSDKERVTLKTMILDLALAFKCIGFYRVFKVLKRQQLSKKFYPKGNYIKPLIMGAFKDFYGKGTAAKLVLQVKDFYKENKLPVIIDTVSDYNVKLYQKFGFKIIGKEESLGYPLYFLRLN